MTTWQSIQYKAVTAPVGDPGDWIEEPPGTQTTGGWLVATNEVVRPVEYRHGLPSLFFVGDPIESVDTIPVWNFVRDAVWPVEYRHLPRGVFPDEPGDFVEPFDTALAPVWNFIRDPVWPIEYCYRLPAFTYQGDPADFVEPSVDVLGWELPTNQAVRPTEYRYLLSWVSQTLFEIPLEAIGVLVYLPARTLEVELGQRDFEIVLPDRAFEVGLREGGRARE